MPLPKSAPREELHNRTIEMRGYRREDGLYDIEGHLTDVKTSFFQPQLGREVPANTPVHDMWVRLVIDEDMLVLEALAVSDATPFPECPGAAPGVSALKGERLTKGWRQAIATKLAGAGGCTHLRELLNTMGSAAHQAMGTIRRAKEDPEVLNARRAGAMINSCHAYSDDGRLVMIRWPDAYKGKSDIQKSG